MINGTFFFFEYEDFVGSYLRRFKVELRVSKILDYRVRLVFLNIVGVL